jgi:hypothetical protein
MRASILCVLLLSGCAVTPKQLLDDESAAINAAVPLGTSLDIAKDRIEELGYTCVKTIYDAPRTWTSSIACSKRVKKGFPSCSIDVRIQSSLSQNKVEGLQFSGTEACQ